MNTMNKEYTPPFKALSHLTWRAAMDNDTTVEQCLEWNEIVATELRALELIKSKCKFDFLEETINDMPIRYEIHIRPKDEEPVLFNSLTIFPKNKEEYDLLREVLYEF